MTERQVALLGSIGHFWVEITAGGTSFSNHVKILFSEWSTDYLKIGKIWHVKF